LGRYLSETAQIDIRLISEYSSESRNTRVNNKKHYFRSM